MQTLPWVEKYRPKSLNDLSGQDKIIELFKEFVKQKDIPHMLLFGPAGTGKTSAVMALARELFGTKFRDRVMEMNASDERGINVVREKIRTFASGAVTAVEGQPSFKIIILDEADSMTKDAQSALRRIIETYSTVTRFCLICNYVSKIIEPLMSRCAMFRFKPLPASSLFNKIDQVCKEEGFNLGTGAFDEVCRISKGDLRTSINLLQSASKLSEHSIEAQTIVEISGTVPSEVIEKLWKAVDEGLFEKCLDIVKMIIYEGFSAQMLIAQLGRDLIENLKYSSAKKMEMFIIIADSEKALVDGADEQLQLLKVISKFLLIK